MLVSFSGTVMRHLSTIKMQLCDLKGSFLALVGLGGLITNLTLLSTACSLTYGCTISAQTLPFLPCWRLSVDYLWSLD